MFLLFKRILNLKVRLITILISFRQYTRMNEIQEDFKRQPWPSRRYTTNRTKKTLKENIKLPQPFEDFADNHAVLRKNIFYIRTITSLICKCK